MTKQIDDLMALARDWVQARTKGHGGSPQQDALRQAIAAALNNWKQLSMTEIAAENHSAMEYCKHWEDRALKAEAALNPGEPQIPQAWLWQFSDGDWHDVPFATQDECEHECAGYNGKAHPLFLAAPPAQTPVKQCAQCGKEHKKCSSGGCPKCAPGVVVSESEFRKPITTQTQPKQEPRTGVWGYIDTQVARDMQGFYEAFGTATPPPRLKDTAVEACIKAVEDAFAWTGGHGEPSKPGPDAIANIIRSHFHVAQTPPPRLTDEQVAEVCNTWLMGKRDGYTFTDAVQDAVRKQFGVTNE